MPILTINNRRFVYQIKRKFINSINLRFTSPQSFYLSCPKLTSKITLNNFINKHQNWIYRNSGKFHLYPKLKNLTHVCILGQPFKIFFQQSSQRGLFLDWQTKTISISDTNFSQKKLTGLYSKYLKPISLQLISNQINKTGLRGFSKITVRNQKTRFGSCSSKQTLSFNWQIIFFPKEKFNHVIFHELVHLKIKNHQKKFYQALSKYDPYWKINNKWLKTEAKKYFLIKS